MFNFFKSKTPLEKLQAQHKSILEEAFKLSKVDRTASDVKYAEANELIKKIEALENKEK